MRDPNRIPIVLTELEKLWKKHPDLRFGQLITIIFDGTKDPFYIEDEETLKEIKERDEEFDNQKI